MTGGQRSQYLPLDERELLQVVAGAATDVIIAIDAASTVLFASASVKRIFGYEAAELLGKPLTMLMPEYLRHVHEQALGRYLDTGKRHIDWLGVEVTGLHRSGREIALEVSFGEAIVNGRHLFTGVLRDISERKARDEEHLRSEERFRLMVETVKDYAIFMLDPDGCVTSWNAGAERIKGYTATEIIGKHFSCFYTEKDLEAGQPERELALVREAGRHEEEGLRVRKDGTAFLANVVVTALYSDDGDLRGFAKVTRDISERKEAERERERLTAELRLERERLNEIFMKAPAFIATLRGPEHHFESANPLYLRLTGRSQIVGKTVREVLPEVQSQGFLELLDHVYQTGEPYVGNDVPVEIEREEDHNATLYYVNFVFQPLRDPDGSISGIFVHGVDVTAQAVARQEAEDARKRLSMLAEASKILGSSLAYHATLANLTQLVVSYLADWCTIALVKGGGGVERVSAAHRDPEKRSLAGQLLEGRDPTRRTHRALFEVLESGLPKLYPHVDREQRSQVTIDPQQLPLVEEMGMESLLIVPLVTQQQTVGAIFMARSQPGSPYLQKDLELAMELANRAAVAVDNARLHEESRELNEELEQRVVERTKELESFSYSVSHDLRAPLRGIDGFSQALQEDFGERLGETGTNYLQRVRAGAKRMGELIDDLLNLSRLARSETHSERVLLSEVAEQIVEDLRRRDPSRHAAIAIQPGLVATGDRRLLTVLMENLLENAWKFTRQRERAEIEVGRTTTEHGETFFVRDNGAGFDMAYAERLFAAFQRLHGPEEFEGTGIGLATVQRVVERHEGIVWAEGEVDKGATFYFTLEE